MAIYPFVAYRFIGCFNEPSFSWCVIYVNVPDKKKLYISLGNKYMSKTCFISQINKTLFIQTENNYWYYTTYIDVTKLFCLLKHQNHSFFIYISIYPKEFIQASLWILLFSLNFNYELFFSHETICFTWSEYFPSLLSWLTTCSQFPFEFCAADM